MSTAEKQNPATHQWYILRGEMKYGPYEYRTLLKMIQSSELFDYNFVWNSSMEGWKLISDLPEFSKDRLCRLIESKDHLAKEFTERKHPRASVEVPLFAHNDRRFFDGYSLSVSQNGALLLLNDPLLLPGYRLLVNFRTSDQNPVSFNAICEVVRKNFTKQRLNVKSGLHYAVRFLQVQETGIKQILKWTQIPQEETQNDSIYKFHE